MYKPVWVFVSVVLSCVLLSEPVAGSDFRRQVEEDWLLQEKYSRGEWNKSIAITPAMDAAGGCDGIKDGRYGFHTGAAGSPWWQVDLGGVYSISKVLVWNRCDGASERADSLSVSLSRDGGTWERVYSHDGTLFYGFPDGNPLEVRLGGIEGRYVRVSVEGNTYLHLDEVEVYGAEEPARNLALKAKADQVSVSQWSSAHITQDHPIYFAERTREKLALACSLCEERSEEGIDTTAERESLDKLARQLGELQDDQIDKGHYFKVRWILRGLSLSNPLLDTEAILFAKRVPGSFSHMSDQYIGWWSRPGGGIHVLRDYRGESPSVECISGAFEHAGSFLRPMISYDGKKVLFAWCRYYPGLAGEQNKLDKGNVPEDAFYHVFEMNVDGSGVRQLTRGKYDDFDARYLPDGRIVFCSTRRGQFVQCGMDTAQQSVMNAALGDVYVRCGGGPERPCVVYTLHTMNSDGGNICAISPFEMFEWTPAVADDGSILYSRWDYIDRDNMPYMSLWATSPSGTNARIVYANYSRTPHCTFEPRSVPGSNKIVFTASGHHSQTKGSLVLLDCAAGDEGAPPITRLTPEVVFPEAEGWPLTYYANPWPLSERFHLVAWGDEGAMSPGPPGWDRWHAVGRPANGMGLYFFDAKGCMELLYRDPKISSLYPIPVKARSKPFLMAEQVDWKEKQQGCFLLADVYSGLKTVERGDVKSLRIVAVPPKTHPTMDYPTLGITRDDPGKCVLGTVPVEDDGSAYFRVPSGVIVFFQALDERGMAIQTMRSTTHVQPGQTLSCIGCHESRRQAPHDSRPIAATRPPSKIELGPEGSWPLRFDRLVQPVIDRHCASCHGDGGADEKAREFDLTAAKAYDSLVDYGKPSLREHVWQGYRDGRSTEGACAASTSSLLGLLTGPGGHHDVKLEGEDLERLIIWMDTYAQRAGSFSEQQEQQLEQLKSKSMDLLLVDDRR